MGSVTRGNIVARSSCPNCASDQLTEAGALLCLSCGDTFTPPGWGWDAESFGAQDKKALAGGTLPVPMTWIDGGGQLPYSHVVIDVSGSMMQSTFVPNVGPDKHNRMEYVYFLLRTMLDNGAITKNTKLYPMGDYHPHPTTRFVSAGMVLEPSDKGGAWGTFYHPDTPWTPGYDSEVGKVFYQIFEPKFGSSEMKWVNELPHTKTLLITDVGVQSLARSIGVSQGSFNHNPPLDIISW